MFHQSVKSVMMKKFSVEENMSLEKIKTKLWSILEVFKKENISSDDYHVLLFFLSAYKDGLLSADLIEGKNNLNISLNKKLQKSKTELSNQYLSIIHIFEISIQRLSEIGLKNVLKKITTINKEVLTDNFTFLFNSLLFRISQSQGKYAGEFIQSVELTRLMCNLANLENNENVFNPFAGLASFNIFLSQGQNYLGKEEDELTWALGKLRLMAYGRSENARYDNDDSIYYWPDNSNKFDLIISIPPIGLDLRSQNIRGKFIHTYRRVEQLLIERSIENLSPNGKVITIVPLSFLQRSHGEEHILANLIDNDLIETIISLPGGLILNTGIPITILVLNKAKKIPGKVKFIDAKKFVVSKGLREKVLEDFALEDFIRSNKEDDSVIRIVDNQQIRLNNYNLSVPRYFRKEIDGIKLCDILEFVRGNKDENWEAAKLIRISDLKDDKVDFTLKTSSVLICEIKQPDSYLISESCLLVAMRGWRLKPTLFELNGETIFKSRDIFSFKINETNVDKAYLVNELHADYVLEQLEAVRLGWSNPTISLVDFLEIVIKLPSLKEQKAKALGALSAYKDSRIKESKLENEINFLKNKFNEELREKQHCIRQHLKNVVDSIAVINSFMAQQNGTINSNDVINPNRNVTVAQRFEAMSNSIQSLGLEIDNLTNDELYDKPELVGIRDVLKECILELGDTKSFSFLEFFDEYVLNEYGDNNPKFSISKRSFKELFNNIVMNASLHGFSEKKECIIKISVTIEEDKLKVTFLNNGKPLAVGMREYLGVKGKKAGLNAGSGIGVSKVIEIANHYGFKYRIIDLPEDEYPFGWEFKFTLTELN